MSNANADIVLCEDGKSVVAYLYDGVDDLKSIIALGQTDSAMSDDEFDETPWRRKLAEMNNSGADAKENALLSCGRGCVGTGLSLDQKTELA